MRARAPLHAAGPWARNRSSVGAAKTGSSSSGPTSRTVSPTATPILRPPPPTDGEEKTPKGRFATPKSEPVGTGGQSARPKSVTPRSPGAGRVRPPPPGPRRPRTPPAAPSTVEAPGPRPGVLRVLGLHGGGAEAERPEGVDHHRHLVGAGLADGRLHASRLRAMHEPRRAEADRAEPDARPLPGHEVAPHVEEHLVGVDVGVVVGHRHGLGMEVEEAGHERADHEVGPLEGLVDG